MKKTVLLAMLLVVLGAAIWWSWSQMTAEPNERRFKRPFPSPTLPRDPIARRAAVDSILRLRPDRRFLLAASELAGAATADARFQDGRWVVTLAGKDAGSVSELPDFSELLDVLQSLAQARAARENLEGPPAPAGRVLRNEEDALPALRAAQKAWTAGPHTRAALHEAAAATAALAFYMFDVIEVADALGAHALALAALDMAAGNDARGTLAMTAVALDYGGAATTLLRDLPGEDALKHFLSADDAHLEEDARLREATPADRYLRLRRLVHIGDEDGVSRWLDRAPREERLSLATLAHVGRQSSMKAYWQASFALPTLIAARVEGLAIEPAGGSFKDALAQEKLAAATALRLEGNEDLDGRIATAARKLDRDAAGPLLRRGDSAGYFLALLTSAVVKESQYYEVDQANREAARKFAKSLGAHEDPALDQAERVIGAIAANDAMSAIGALTEPGHLATGQTAMLLHRIDTRVPFADTRLLEAILHSAPRFDTRIVGRILWANIRAKNLYEVAEPRKLRESVLRISAADHPEMAQLIAAADRDAAALKAISQDKSNPWANREWALNDYVALAKPQDAEELLRTFADSDRGRYRARQPLIRFLSRRGKHEEARAQAMEWLQRYDEPSRALEAAWARCDASWQDFEMEHWADGLKVIEPAIPAYPLCALDYAASHLLMLGRKEEANKLVEAWLKRYTNTLAVAEAAWAYWTQGDDEAATRTLASPAQPLDNREWFWTIGDRFSKAFRKRPAEDVQRATRVLLTRIHPGFVSDLGTAMVRHGEYEHAFALDSLIDVKPPDRYVQTLKTAAALKGWKGAEASREWLSAHLPKPLTASDALAFATFAHRERLDEQLFDLPEPQNDAARAESFWLLRAAALLRLGKEATPEMRTLVEAHYATPHDGREFRLGRHLLGKLPEKDLAALVDEGAPCSQVPYYAGLKAQAEGRMDDAAAWYRDAIFCLRSGESEYRWAYDQLWRLREAKKS